MLPIMNSPMHAEHGADEQQAKRIDAFDDRSGEEPQHEHQARGVHQQQDAVRNRSLP